MASRREPGDWDCNKCGNTGNFKWRTYCHTCGQKRDNEHRSKPPERRVGDWNCQTCGKHQFARNTRCRDCARDREADKDDAELCVVCQDAPREIMLLHGDTGHTCVCSVCAEKLQGKCPMCRQPIVSTIRNYQ